MLGVAFFRKPGGHVYPGVGGLDNWTRGADPGSRSGFIKEPKFWLVF